LEIARKTLPNDPRVPELIGYIVRRQGKQDEAIKYFQRALELDPRNFFILQQVALSYQNLRRYPEMAAALDRAVGVKPGDIDSEVARASTDFDWKADTRPVHQTMDTIEGKDPAAVRTFADTLFLVGLAERNASVAERGLRELGENNYNIDSVVFNHHFCEGVIARMAKDQAKATAAFTAALAEQEKVVQADPNFAQALSVLGLIHAGLGRKEEALKEGRRAVELLPISKDSINGVHMIEYYAMIAAWVGEKDLACEQLAKAVQLPGTLSYGQLKLLPYWDPLRGDPRFEKIVASLAPK
jgi:serine/threonine-protein kinase